MPPRIVKDYIRGKVLRSNIEAGRTTFLVNRGVQDGVRRGAVGKVVGHECQVVMVWATRSKIVADIEPDRIRSGTIVKIIR